MGLKDLAEAGKKNSSKKGLKNLAELKRLDSENKKSASPFFFQAKHSFREFLKDINISKAGFLVKDSDDNYVFSFPMGVGISSFNRLIIPAQIIKSKLKHGKTWTELKDSKLSSFINFFSSQEYIGITEILLYSLKDDEEFLMLIRSQKDSNSVYDFDFNDANEKIKKFIPVYTEHKKIFHSAKPLSFLKAREENAIENIEEALKMQLNASLFRISFKALFPDNSELEQNLKALRLYSSLLNKISSSVSSRNLIVLRNDLLFCIFSKQAVTANLYLNQVKNILRPIYGDEICDRLISENASHSTNKKEILNFLKIEENDKTGKDTFNI